MEMEQTIKKKIMFSKGDDFYFLSYNIILILYGLGCFCGQRKFKDYRKLAFLIDFISNRNLTQTISKQTRLFNPVDRELFTRAYANGMLRLNQIVRLLFTLEKRGLVILDREPDKDVVNVCLNKAAVEQAFFDKELFQLEIGNIEILNKSIPRTNILALDTLLERLFDNYGIKTWANY